MAVWDMQAAAAVDKLGVATGVIRGIMGIFAKRAKAQARTLPIACMHLPAPLPVRCTLWIQVCGVPHRVMGVGRKRCLTIICW